MLKNIDKRALLSGLGLWLLWVPVAFVAGILTVGWMAGFGLSFQRLIGGIGGEAAPLILLAYVVGGLLFAPLAAFLQYIVARRGLRRARGWMWTTIGAWMCCFVAAPFLSVAFGKAATVELLSTEVVAAAVIVATLQWRHLRGRVDKAFYWIVGAAGGWGLAGYAFATLSRDSDLSAYAAMAAGILLAAMVTGIAVVFLFKPVGTRAAPTVAAACVSVILVLVGWLYVNASYRQQLSTYWGHETSVNSVAFSPDGKFVASAGSGSLSTPRDAAATVRLWAVSGGGQIRPSDAKVIELPRPSSYPNDFASMVFAQGGSVLAADVEQGAVTVWDVMTSDQVLHLHVTAANRRANALAFARDESLLAVPGANSSLKLYDVGNGAGLAVLSPEQQRTQIEALALSPGGELIAAAYFAGGDVTRVLVWDVSTARQLWALTGPRQPLTLAFSPDGALLAAGGELPGRPAVNNMLPAADGQFPVPPKSPAQAAAIVWDLKTGQVKHSIEGVGITSLAFSPDGAVLAMGRRYGHGIQLWNLADGRELAVLHGGQDVESIAYSDDGRLIVTGSSDGAIRLWAAPESKSRD